MPRNVELKAVLSSGSDLSVLASRAKLLTGSEGRMMRQRDVFFNVTDGRLKLRYEESDGEVVSNAQLIFYRRPDTLQAKMSDFHVCTITNMDEAEQLEGTLTLAFGVKGVVKKRRRLFLLGQTRIHLDEVDTLSSFLELEVCLDSEQSEQEGQQVANELFMKLVAGHDHEQSIAHKLVQGAYMDLILQKD